MMTVAYRNLYLVQNFDDMAMYEMMIQLLQNEKYIPTLHAYVTGSAKKGHNCTSLNLQYKALNTLGETLMYD